MKLIELILSLLQKLVGALEKQQKRQEQQQHEERVNDVQDNPANWFDDHFNGMRNNGLPDDASEADKANTGKPEKNERGRDNSE